MVARLWVITTKSIVLGQPPQRVREAADVRLVEGRVDLVQDAERHRVDAEHGEQQRHAGQRPLAAGQHRQALEPLAGRPHHDLDAAGRLAVLAVAELQGGRATGEQEPAEVVEPLADGREGGVEARGDVRIQLRDQLFGAVDGAAQVRVLGGQVLQPRRTARDAPRPRTGLTEPICDSVRRTRRSSPSSGVVVERRQLGHQLLAGRDGLAGRRLRRFLAVGLRDGTGLRQRVEGELALPRQRRQGLLMPGRLDGCGLRLAFQLAQPGLPPPPRAPGPPAPPASDPVRRPPAPRASAAAWSASRRRAAAASSSARSTVSRSWRDALRRDGGLRLHLARGLDRAAALPRRAGGPRSRRAAAWAVVQASRARSRSSVAAAAALAQRGHLGLPGWSTRHPARPPHPASAAGSAAWMAASSSTMRDSARPGSLRRELRGLQIGRRRALVALARFAARVARPPAVRPASVTAAIARAASAAAAACSWSIASSA